MSLQENILSDDDSVEISDVNKYMSSYSDFLQKRTSNTFQQESNSDESVTYKKSRQLLFKRDKPSKLNINFTNSKILSENYVESDTVVSSSDSYEKPNVPTQPKSLFIQEKRKTVPVKFSELHQKTDTQLNDSTHKTEQIVEEIQSNDSSSLLEVTSKKRKLFSQNVKVSEDIKKQRYKDVIKSNIIGKEDYVESNPLVEAFQSKYKQQLKQATVDELNAVNSDRTLRSSSKNKNLFNQNSAIKRGLFAKAFNSLSDSDIVKPQTKKKQKLFSDGEQDVQTSLLYSLRLEGMESDQDAIDFSDKNFLTSTRLNILGDNVDIGRASIRNTPKSLKSHSDSSSLSESAKGKNSKIVNEENSPVIKRVLNPVVLNTSKSHKTSEQPLKDSSTETITKTNLKNKSTRITRSSLKNLFEIDEANVILDDNHQKEETLSKEVDSSKSKEINKSRTTRRSKNKSQNTTDISKDIVNKNRSKSSMINKSVDSKSDTNYNQVSKDISEQINKPLNISTQINQSNTEKLSRNKNLSQNASEDNKVISKTSNYSKVGSMANITNKTGVSKSNNEDISNSINNSLPISEERILKSNNISQPQNETIQKNISGLSDKSRTSNRSNKSDISDPINKIPKSKKLSNQITPNKQQSLQNSNYKSTNNTKSENELKSPHSYEQSNTSRILRNKSHQKSVEREEETVKSSESITSPKLYEQTNQKRSTRTSTNKFLQKQLSPNISGIERNTENMDTSESENEFEPLPNNSASKNKLSHSENLPTKRQSVRKISSQNVNSSKSENKSIKSNDEIPHLSPVSSRTTNKSALDLEKETHQKFRTKLSIKSINKSRSVNRTKDSINFSKSDHPISDSSESENEFIQPSVSPTRKSTLTENKSINKSKSVNRSKDSVNLSTSSKSNHPISDSSKSENEFIQPSESPTRKSALIENKTLGNNSINKSKSVNRSKDSIDVSTLSKSNRSISDSSKSENEFIQPSVSPARKSTFTENKKLEKKHVSNTRLSQQNVLNNLNEVIPPENTSSKEIENAPILPSANTRSVQLELSVDNANQFETVSNTVSPNKLLRQSTLMKKGSLINTTKNKSPRHISTNKLQVEDSDSSLENDDIALQSTTNKSYKQYEKSISSVQDKERLGATEVDKSDLLNQSDKNRVESEKILSNTIQNENISPKSIPIPKTLCDYLGIPNKPNISKKKKQRKSIAKITKKDEVRHQNILKIISNIAKKSPPKSDSKIEVNKLLDNFPSISTNVRYVEKPKPKKKTKPDEVNPINIIDGKVYKPKKLYTGKHHWINTTFYKYLQSKMKLKYAEKTVKKSEQLAILIADTYSHITKKGYNKEKLDFLKLKLAECNIITTHADFFNFALKFLPDDFFYKVASIPIPFTTKYTIDQNPVALCDNIIKDLRQLVEE